jgi:hypothetical protein
MAYRSGALRAMFRAGLAAALFAAAPVHAAGIEPTASTRVMLSYSGTFDLANAIVPQVTQHSYVYHVQWAYSWSGTWGELFNEGSPTSTQMSFDTSHISGKMHATWRDAAAGPLVACTLRIVPVTGDYPDFAAIYSADRGTVRVDGLESPTSEYGQYAGGSSDPLSMCGGGPEIDIFGAPHSWSPLGERAVTLELGDGVHHYDRTWAWTYRFSSGFRRIYASAMHTTLALSFLPG